MDSDLATLMVSTRSAPTRAAVQTAVLKQSHEQDQQVVDMIAQSSTTLSPPPPGQGTRVDKLA